MNQNVSLDHLNKHQEKTVMSHVDVISNLPDDVLSSILSRLPTKDVARTSVLSLEWEHKWTSVYNIDIREEEEDSSANFVSFVDNILFSFKSRITSFRLVCRKKYDVYHLRQWVSTILRRHVQVLEIEAYRCGRVDLPRCLSSCTSLIDLKLSVKCTLRFHVENCFQNLKRLSLFRAIIQNEQSPDTGSLLLNFPALEKLCLRQCKWWNASFVEIRAPELIYFKVVNVDPENSDRQIKICGSKLKRFKSHHGLLALFDICAPSVSVVSLRHKVVYNAHRSRACTVLKSFPCLSEMTLTSEIAEVIVQLKPPAVPPIFGCLRYLYLDSAIKTRDLFELFKLTPVLEELVVRMSSRDDHDNSEQMETPPTCLVSKLKKVLLLKFSGTKGHVALGKFFLENATDLEELRVQVVPDTASVAEPGVQSLRSTIPNSSKCVLYESSLPTFTTPSPMK